MQSTLGRGAYGIPAQRLWSVEAFAHLVISLLWLPLEAVQYTCVYTTLGTEEDLRRITWPLRNKYNFAQGIHNVSKAINV
jgi:hypothetical protein